MRTRNHRAFTLIEVLVVVAIIALLCAILLPSLANARENAMTVMCKTRIREIYNGHILYAQDAKGRFPHYDWWLWDGMNNEPQSLFVPNLYARFGGTRPTDSSRWVEMGQIYRYVKNKEVYFCAKDTRRRAINGIGGNGPRGSKPIHSFVRFIEPHDFMLRHDTKNASAQADEGVLTSADFINPDKLKRGVFDGYLPAAPGGAYTTTPDRIGLMYEEWPGADDRLQADTPGNNDNALNDGYSGFMEFNDFMAARHRSKGTVLFWDGHAAYADKRFNFYPGDPYAAIVAFGRPKN